MVVLDKFLNFMKLGDEDEGYEEEEYFDDDESDLDAYASSEDEEETSSPLFSKNTEIRLLKREASVQEKQLAVQWERLCLCIKTQQWKLKLFARTLRRIPERLQIFF